MQGYLASRVTLPRQSRDVRFVWCMVGGPAANDIRLGPKYQTLMQPAAGVHRLWGRDRGDLMAGVLGVSEVGVDL